MPDDQRAFDPELFSAALGHSLTQHVETALRGYPVGNDLGQAALTACVILSGQVLAWATGGLDDEERLGVLEEFFANLERTTLAMVMLRGTPANEEEPDDA